MVKQGKNIILWNLKTQLIIFQIMN
jgi:hypothetical protein